MSIDYTKIYYKEWVNDAGWDMRLEIQPANNAIGSTSSGDYVLLGASLMSLKTSKYSFKDTPVGMPDAATLGVEFDFGELPSNLQDILLNPQADSQGDGDLGMMMQVDGTSASTSTIPVSNIVRLFSNRGDVGGVPTAASITSAGTGHTTGSGATTTTSGTGSGCTVDLVADDAGGVATYSLDTPGTGYTSDTSVNLIAITGTGSGAKVSYTDDGAGGIATIDSLDAAGTGYHAGDTVYVNNGGHDAVLTVLTVTVDGHIISFVLHGGTGYKVGDTLSFATGTGYLTISAVTREPRYVEFIGAQSTEYGGKLGVDSTGAITGKIEIVFYDAVKTALENIPASVWANTIYRNLYYRAYGGGTFPGGTACASDTTLGRADVFIDEACTSYPYTDHTTIWHEAVVAKDATHGNPQLTASIMSVQKCFGEIVQLLMRRVMPQWIRRNTLRAGSFTISNSPISHIHYYKQDYLQDHKRGTLLSEANVGMTAALVRADSTGNFASASWMNDSTQRLAGLLEEDKNGESFVGGSLWDLLRDIAENFGCKIQWSYSAHYDGSPDVYSYDVDFQYNSPLTRVMSNINLDTETERTESEYYDYSPCAGVISDATGECKNIVGKDLATHVARSEAPRAKARVSFPCILHNHPTVWTYGTNDGSLGYTRNTSPRIFIEQRIPLSLRKLWYFETSPTTPFDDSGIYTSTQRVFKVHETIDYFAGYLGSGGYQFNYAALDDGGDSDANNIDTLAYYIAVVALPLPDPVHFIDPGSLALAQQNAQASAIARALVKMFGNLKQSMISRTFALSTNLHGHAVGDQVSFTAPTGSPIPVHSAASQGYLMSIECDWNRATAKCDILTSGL